MSAIRASRTAAGLLVTASLLPLLVVLLESMPSVQIGVFCAPAARVTAAFIGAPVETIPDGFRIPTALPIDVSAACSGIRFFSLTAAVLAGLAVEQRRGWRFALAVPVLAYLGTLGANASRILCTWYADALFAPHLPLKFQAGAHGLIGALVFTTILALLYATLWRTHHEHRNETPAA